MDRALEVKRTGGKEKGKKEVLIEEEGEEEEEDGEDEKRKRGGVVKKGSSSGSGPCCQAETCSTDLTNARRYHRRHRVCELHSKAPIVLVGGLRQRFCQQCSRFHELSEFDETKRSCRRRLAGHNERRRKSSSDSQAGEGAGGRKGSCSNLKESLCRHSEQGGRMPMATTLPATSSYKHFQIR